MDGVLSVDYTQLVDDEERYLAVFRYRDAEARTAFVANHPGCLEVDDGASRGIVGP